jgi:hypothetical protein
MQRSAPAQTQLPARQVGRLLLLLLLLLGHWQLQAGPVLICDISAGRSFNIK